VPQDAECFICKTSINSMPRSSEGIVRGCACRGMMGLAHVSCLAWQAEMEVKWGEDLHQGEDFEKWVTCFACGQDFHGPVFLALAWACWKTYLGRPETDRYRSRALELLGETLYENDRHAEALPVFEAHLALSRRREEWTHKEEEILDAQDSVADCLCDLGRHDEALVLWREIYARRVDTLGVSHETTIDSQNVNAICLDKMGRHDEALVLRRVIYAKSVATRGVSHESTISEGNSLVLMLIKLELWDEARSLLRDQLLPVARQSLGADADLTLDLNMHLARALSDYPEPTRKDLRLSRETSMRPALISTQATTCSKPRPSCRTWSRGGGGSSAPPIRTRI